MVNGVVQLVLLFVFVSNSVQQDGNVVKKDEIKDINNCPLGPVVTATACCQFGNNVWDYASILALSRLLPGNRLPYIRQHQANDLKRYFKEPFLPIVEDIPLNCSCWNAADLLKVNEGNILAHYRVSAIQQWDKPGNVVLESPAVVAEAVMQDIKFIKSRLQYKDELIQDANEVFSNISLKFSNQDNVNYQSLTYVGVHVRRTDYLPTLGNGESVSANFFNFAFDYFRNRKQFGKCVFLVVSDDIKWVNENIIANKTNSDVFLVSNGISKDPRRDITLLSFCNHTIFDYGSFGLWGAVYAGGEVVTSSSYPKGHQFIRYQNFHFFDAVPDKELFKVSWFEKPV